MRVVIVIEALRGQLIDEVGQEGLHVFDFVAPEQAKHVGYEARGCLSQLRAKVSNKG